MWFLSLKFEVFLIVSIDNLLWEKNAKEWTWSCFPGKNKINISGASWEVRFILAGLLATGGFIFFLILFFFSLYLFCFCFSYVYSKINIVLIRNYLALKRNCYEGIAVWGWWKLDVFVFVFFKFSVCVYLCTHVLTYMLARVHG